MGTVWTAAQTSFIFSIYGSSSERTNEARVILYPCCDRYLKTCQVLTLGPEVGGYGRIWVRKRMCIIYEIQLYGSASQLPAMGMSPGLPNPKTSSAKPFVFSLRR